MPQKSPNLQNIIRVQKFDAAERVRNNLLRCPTGLPGKPPCDLVERQADSLGMAAYYSLAFSDAEIDGAVRDSVDGDGRPWRGPQFRAERRGDFSRDHVVSLAQWALGARDKDVLSRVLDYARRHDWKVCPQDKCLLTPGLLSVMGDVVEHNGGGRPYGTNIPAAVHEQQVVIEAASGERCDLVLDKVLLKAKTGKLTKAYVEAVKRCAGKVPLYGTYVRAVATDGNIGNLVVDLTSALKAWNGPTAGGHWGSDANGWALCALAKILEEPKSENFVSSIASGWLPDGSSE